MSGKQKIYLISAAPDKRDRISVKVLHLIQQADVVIYDHLIPAEVVALIPSHTARIIVGKKGRAQRDRQGAINELLLRLASCRCVVRLKGEDPASAGCFGEEARFLAQHGIDFEVLSCIDASPSTPGFEVSHAGIH